MIELDSGNFEKEVLKADKRILVDFNANWCGPCQMMRPVLEEINNSEGTKGRIFSVNIDKNVVLAEEYRISSIPCLVFFENGKEIKRLVGLTSKSKIIKIMER